MHKTRTAVALDPHPIWVDALQLVLESIEVEVVGKTCTSFEALELIERHQPDLFLLESVLTDGMTGPELIQAARKARPSLRTIVLSASSEPHDIDGAFDAGALAYVLK